MKTEIGIMAEDHSDIDTLRVLILRINAHHFKVRKYCGKGCSKLRRKCSKIACHWVAQNVTHIIICHDLDGDSNRLKCLKEELREKISSIPNSDRVVCIVIPVQELEAWLLADISVLNKRFSGIGLKEIHNPEQISSPKEYIERASCVRKWKPRYVNTIHNQELAEDLNIDKVRAKCPAFRPFYDFVSTL